MKKKGNKRIPIPKEKLVYNPIPTSLFLFDIYYVCVVFYVYEDTAGTIDTLLTKGMFTQRCRDGVSA